MVIEMITTVTTRPSHEILTYVPTAWVEIEMQPSRKSATEGV